MVKYLQAEGAAADTTTAALNAASQLADTQTRGTLEKKNLVPKVAIQEKKNMVN